MLLTLSANSLRSLLMPSKSGKAKLDLLDLPTMARGELGLHGLTLSTELFSGAPRERYDRLRERADKAGCACLLLVESEPQRLGEAGEAAAGAAVERVQRVLQAGSILGCSAVAVRPAGEDDQAVFGRTVERLKKIAERAERLEMNVLLWSGSGLTSTPDRVTELIKKVGGFRMGTLPDFEIAAASPDPVAYMRRLTPYASSVIAATSGFAGPKGEKLSDAPPAPGEQLKHSTHDLGKLVEAILSVGYDASLAIEYRGPGDAKLGVVRSRVVLERLLGLGEQDAIDEAIDEEGDEGDAEVRGGGDDA